MNDEPQRDHVLTLAKMHPVFFIRAARYVVLPPGALAISTIKHEVNECTIDDTTRRLIVYYPNGA